MTSGPAPTRPAPDPAVLAGLPDGAFDLARRWWRRGDDGAERAGLAPSGLDGGELDRRIAEELTAPLVLGPWPGPVRPRPVADGWIHDEVIDDDRQLFEAVLATWADRGAEAVAAAAQDLRLPVTPYRRLPGPTDVRATDRGRTGPPSTSTSTSPDEPSGSPPGRWSRAGAPFVVDLSTHWAGPLVGARLAEAGARVVKIDPDCRPDGFRSRHALYHRLNGAKEIIDLDLRRHSDRDRFEHLLGRADLLIESFSRRVLPNLGYEPTELRRRHPRLTVLSIKAFPARWPEADWLAYGPGVHAASGLGLLGTTPQPAPIAYADPLAGIEAFARATALLAGPGQGRATVGGAGGTGIDGGPTEVSLAGAIAPLVDRARQRRAEQTGPGPGSTGG